MFFPRDNHTGEGDGDDEYAIVHLSRLPEEVTAIYACVTGYEDRSFEEVTDVYVRVVDVTGDGMPENDAAEAPGGELAVAHLSGSDIEAVGAQHLLSVVFLRFVRDEGWSPAALVKPTKDANRQALVHSVEELDRTRKISGADPLDASYRSLRRSAPAAIANAAAAVTDADLAVRRADLRPPETSPTPPPRPVAPPIVAENQRLAAELASLEESQAASARPPPPLVAPAASPDPDTDRLLAENDALRARIEVMRAAVRSGEEESRQREQERSEAKAAAAAAAAKRVALVEERSRLQRELDEMRRAAEVLPGPVADAVVAPVRNHSSTTPDPPSNPAGIRSLDEHRSRLVANVNDLQHKLRDMEHVLAAAAVLEVPPIDGNNPASIAVVTAGGRDSVPPDSPLRHSSLLPPPQPQASSHGAPDRQQLVHVLEVERRRNASLKAKLEAHMAEEAYLIAKVEALMEANAATVEAAACDQCRAPIDVRLCAACLSGRPSPGRSTTLHRRVGATGTDGPPAFADSPVVRRNIPSRATSLAAATPLRPPDSPLVRNWTAVVGNLN